MDFVSPESRSNEISQLEDKVKEVEKELNKKVIEIEAVKKDIQENNEKIESLEKDIQSKADSVCAETQRIKLNLWKKSLMRRKLR